MKRYALALVSLAWLAACGAGPSNGLVERPDPEAAVEAEQASTPVEPEEPNPLERFAGTFYIPEVRTEECGGRVFLAEGNITIHPEAGTLEGVLDPRYNDPDPVRIYSARVEEGRLVADGNFPMGGCPEGHHFARFVLELTEAGNLEGELIVLWPLPPGCDRPCRMTFPVEATRISGR